MISHRQQGASSWFHNVHNGLTNVSHITDSSGTVAAKYAYDAFGNIVSQSGTLINNYRFQTKELHVKSNLVYFGTRWYNPVIGRWLTPDPLGIIDGPNLYVYLNNNPINLLDPWGLCEGVEPASLWEQEWQRVKSELDRNDSNVREIVDQVTGSIVGVKFVGKAIPHKGFINAF